MKLQLINNCKLQRVTPPGRTDCHICPSALAQKKADANGRPTITYGQLHIFERVVLSSLSLFFFSGGRPLLPEPIKYNTEIHILCFFSLLRNTRLCEKGQKGWSSKKKKKRNLTKRTDFECFCYRWWHPSRRPWTPSMTLMADTDIFHPFCLF